MTERLLPQNPDTKRYPADRIASIVKATGRGIQDKVRRFPATAGAGGATGVSELAVWTMNGTSFKEVLIGGSVVVVGGLVRDARALRQNKQDTLNRETEQDRLHRQIKGSEEKYDALKKEVVQREEYLRGLHAEEIGEVRAEAEAKVSEMQAQIEEVTQEAYQKGVAEGFEEGWEKGCEEGVKSEKFWGRLERLRDDGQISDDRAQLESIITPVDPDTFTFTYKDKKAAERVVGIISASESSLKGVMHHDVAEEKVTTTLALNSEGTEFDPETDPYIERVFDENSKKGTVDFALRYVSPQVEGQRESLEIGIKTRADKDNPQVVFSSAHKKMKDGNVAIATPYVTPADIIKTYRRIMEKAFKA